MMITEDIVKNIGGISLKVDDLLQIEEAETISQLVERSPGVNFIA